MSSKWDAFWTRARPAEAMLKDDGLGARTSWTREDLFVRDTILLTDAKDSSEICLLKVLQTLLDHDKLLDRGVSRKAS